MKKINRFILLVCSLSVGFLACNKPTNNNKPMNSTVLDSNTLYLYGGDQIIDSFPNKDSLLFRYTAEWYLDGFVATEGYTMEEGDFDFGFRFIHYSLTRQGYKPVSDSLFYAQIESKFGITRESVSQKNMIIPFRSFFVLVKQKEEKDIPNLVFSPEMDYLYFSTQYHCLSSFPTSARHSEKLADNNLKLIEHPYIYHLNNFVFHDSNASLTWMVNNEVYLVKDLVYQYGYDKNDKLNRTMFDLIYKEYTSILDANRGGETVEALRLYENFFAGRDIYGNLQIREGLMQSLVDMTTFQDNTYMKEMLEKVGNNVISSIVDPRRAKYDLFSTYTKDEKFKILAYLTYYIEQAYIKNGIDYLRLDAKPTWNLRSFLNFELKHTPGFVEYLEKNNYYNLPDYKELVEYNLRIADENGWG